MRALYAEGSTTTPALYSPCRCDIGPSLPLMGYIAPLECLAIKMICGGLQRNGLQQGSRKELVRQRVV